MTARERPNLLFILTDQQRADALGSLSPWLATPTLDRLAAEGVHFRRCVAQSPGCIPSRASLMTGLYPHNTGVWHARQFTLPATARTWVRKIKEAGYRTSVIGKTHLHPHAGDLRDRRSLVEAWGFEDVTEIAGPRSSAGSHSEMTDEWAELGLLEAFRDDLRAREGDDRFAVRPSPLGAEHHYDAFVGSRAAEQIRSYERDRPWFCWIGFGGPHEPWDAPEPYFSMYEPTELPQPLPATESVAAQRPRGALLDGRLEEEAERLGRLEPDALSALRANYAGKVSMIDHWVGAILAAVEERGELERTIVVFASDHGEMNGDHGLIHKSCFFEGAVTVPLLIRAPELFQAGRVLDDPVQLIDLGPTLAEAAGTSIDYPQWGRTLWPLMSGEASTGSRVAMSEQRGEVMLTDARWKVALNNDGEVYLCTDLRDDPEERMNLAGSSLSAGVERELRDRVLARLLETQLMDDWH